MATYFVASQSYTLDELDDVSGFSQAKGGVVYGLKRAQAGTSYEPALISDSLLDLDPNGGLQVVGGLLSIKKDNTSGDSGVGLSSDGLEVVDRVKTGGDTMSGDLDMDGNLVKGLPTEAPTYVGDEAVSWAQAVRLVGDASDTLVEKDGDTMTGDLNMSGRKVTTPVSYTHLTLPTICSV